MWTHSKTFSPIGALLQVWDAFGRLLYQSSLFDYPVTSVAWSPSGEQFAVGSFNTMQLCDRMGWAYSKVRRNREGQLLAALRLYVPGACWRGRRQVLHTV